MVGSKQINRRTGQGEVLQELIIMRAGSASCVGAIEKALKQRDVNNAPACAATVPVPG